MLTGFRSSLVLKTAMASVALLAAAPVLAQGTAAPATPATPATPAAPSAAGRRASQFFGKSGIKSRHGHARGRVAGGGGGVSGG